MNVRRCLRSSLGRALIMSALMLACSASEDAARPRVLMARSSFVNEGKVCLAIDTKVAPAPAMDAQGATFLVEGAPLTVSVHASQQMPERACLQASSRCLVTLQGTTLAVESQLHYDLEGKVDCTATSTAAIVCDGPPLAAGEYVLQHGASRGAFRVPAATPLPLCVTTKR